MSSFLPESGGSSAGNAPSSVPKYLVLDANAIISGNCLGLYHSAEKIVTIAEVFDEIKDSKARDLLDRLPFEIDTLTPSLEACQAGKYKCFSAFGERVFPDQLERNCCTNYTN